MRRSVILRKMIELCTFRQMVFFIFLLVSISIIFLTVESYFATSKRNSHKLQTVSASNISSSGNCWETEDFVIKQECIPCTKFEKVSGHVAACTETGFKEVLTCSKQGDVARSCNRVPWLEERNFIIFEVVMICSSVASALTVLFQQRRLERKMLARIQKQIAAEF